MRNRSPESQNFWGQVVKETGRTMRTAPTSWPYTVRLCALLTVVAATVVLLLPL